MIESKIIDFRIKKIQKIEELEALENLGKPVELDDGDWSSYKKNKNRIIIGNRNRKNRIKILNVSIIKNNLKTLFILKKFSINYIKLIKYDEKIFYLNSLLSKNARSSYYKQIIILYNKINLKFLKNIKNETLFKSFNNKVIVILDIRQIKPKLILMNKNKCIFTLTSGIIFKKMKMQEKNLKKKTKMLNIMIKTLILYIKKNSWNNIIINIKGTKSNLSSILLFIKNNFNREKLFFLYSPFIKERKKFKKIKAIKRKLRKKIIIFK